MEFTYILPVGSDDEYVTNVSHPHFLLLVESEQYLLFEVFHVNIADILS